MGLIGLLVMGGGHPAPTPGIVFLERGSLESTEAKWSGCDRRFQGSLGRKKAGWEQSHGREAGSDKTSRAGDGEPEVGHRSRLKDSIRTPPCRSSACREVGQVPQSRDSVPHGKGAAVSFLGGWGREAETRDGPGGWLLSWAGLHRGGLWGRSWWADCKAPPGTYSNLGMDAKWFLNVWWDWEHHILKSWKDRPQRLEDFRDNLLPSPGLRKTHLHWQSHLWLSDKWNF